MLEQQFQKNWVCGRYQAAAMSEEPILLLGWREFNSTFNGNFTINDRSLLVSEVSWRLLKYKLG